MNDSQLVQLTGRRTSEQPGQLLEEPPSRLLRGKGPAGILHAREATRTFVSGLAPVPGVDAADSLVLVVSELVTNAVRHGGGRYTLALSATPDALVVAVGDTNPEGPYERTPDFDDGGGGFGWHMVRLLSREVSVIPEPPARRGRKARSRGKTIRAVLPR